MKNKVKISSKIKPGELDRPRTLSEARTPGLQPRLPLPSRQVRVDPFEWIDGVIEYKHGKRFLILQNVETSQSIPM